MYTCLRKLYHFPSSVHLFEKVVPFYVTNFAIGSPSSVTSLEVDFYTLLTCVLYTMFCSEELFAAIRNAMTLDLKEQKSKRVLEEFFFSSKIHHYELNFLQILKKIYAKI